MKEITLIGKLGKTNGVKGEIYCYLQEYTTASPSFPPYLLVEKNGKTLPYFVEAAEETDDETFIIAFEDIDSKEKAKKELTNGKVYIKNEDLEEFFIPLSFLNEADDFPNFIGFEMFDQNKKLIGKIKDTFDINGSLIAEIISEKEIFVPINDDLILSVDEEKQTIEVEIAEGLLDVY